MNRPIYIPKQALDAAEVLRELQGYPDGFVFRGDYGKPITGTVHAAYLYKVIKAAGIGHEDQKGVLHWHGLRHYAATELDQHMTRPELKRLLGHSRLYGEDGRRDVTSIYVHPRPELAKAAMLGQQIVDDLMPASIAPWSEVLDMKRKRTEKLRAYHREYQRKLRAARRADRERTEAP
jgi:hypothetical protein